MHDTLISVIIPTRNRAGHLLRAVESVLSQTSASGAIAYAKFGASVEIIIVDNAELSSYVSRALLPRDPCIAIMHEPRKGVAHARNAGLRAARGDLIAFLDDDDYWLPGKLRLQLDIFRKYPHIVALADTKNAEWLLRPLSLPELLLDNIVVCSSVMLRREALPPRPIFRQALAPAEDYDLWLKILRTYPAGFYVLPNKTTFYEDQNRRDRISKDLVQNFLRTRAVLRPYRDLRLEIPGLQKRRNSLLRTALMLFLRNKISP